MSRSKSRRRRPRKNKSNTKKIVLIVALLVAVAAIIVAYNMLGNNVSNENGSTQNITSTQMKVLLETSMGDILIELRDDMPITTENFKNLVQQEVYDGTIFHRVVNIPNNLVIIQGGDPTRTGYGDPSIPSIQDEFSDNPENNKNERGTIAMANTGEPNSGSSQFFINGAYNSHLDNNHPVFGDVIDGLDVVDDILDVETNGEPSNKPLEDVTLIRAQLVD
jgi:peptidylprolyl isomerase